MWALNGRDGSTLAEHGDAKGAPQAVELPPICSSPSVVVISDGAAQLLIPFKDSLKLCPLTSGCFSFECGLPATPDKLQVSFDFCRIFCDEDLFDLLRNVTFAGCV